MPKKTTLPKGYIIYLTDSYQDIWISGIDSKHGIKSIPPVVTVTNDEKKAVRFKTARDAKAFIKKYSIRCGLIESPAMQIHARII